VITICFVETPDGKTCKMAAIRKSCGKDVELGTSMSFHMLVAFLMFRTTRTGCTVFIDGPHLLQPADLAWSSISELGASEASDSDPAIAPRAWWRVNTERTQAVGLDASLASLKDVLQADRYEVCLYHFWRYRPVFG
jgi:hypothetical protein